MQKITFLALTALEKFWDASKSIIFLGDWCSSYGKKNYCKNLNVVSLNYSHIKNDQIADDCKIHDIYEYLLRQLSGFFNHIHATNYSLKYWRILIGPFLYWYIQAIHARYECLKYAYVQYPHLDTIGLAKSSYFTPLNTEEFCSLTSHSDAWNLQLFTQILVLAIKSPTTYQDHDWNKEVEKRKIMVENKQTYKLLTKFQMNFVRILSKIRGAKMVGLYNPEFNKKNLFKLILSSRLRIFPLFPFSDVVDRIPERYTPNLSLRREICQIESRDHLTQIIIDTLQWNMPLNFIENYQLECAKSTRRFPYTVGALLGDWMTDDTFKLWGALNSEKGVKTIAMQHGGGYGALKHHSYALLERENVDFFISWGWKNKNNILPVSSIYISQFHLIFKKICNQSKILENNRLILWAVTEFVKYPTELSIVGYGENYLQSQYKFAAGLSSSVLDRVTMRLRHSDWSEKWKNLHDKFPGLTIHQPNFNDKASFFDQLSAADILIVDNLNTVYLYGLAFNIPTIIFWDPNVWLLTDYAKPYFKALQNVGVFHDSPESAAAMLNKVAANPTEWWESEDVQAARKLYCDTYTRTSDHWLKEWSDLLISVADGEIKS